MRTNKGFTLVEVLVATAILSGVMVVSMMMMNSLAVSSRLERRHSVLMQSAKRAIETSTDAIRMASIVDLPQDAFGNRYDDKIVYQLPVESSGSFLNASFNPIYGMKHQGTPQPGYAAAFRFVPTDTVSEAARGIDINKDGDQVDDLVIGRIEQVFLDAPDLAGATVLVAVPITRDIVVQDPAGQAADLDGDAVPDPLFSMESAIDDVRVLRVTIVVADTVLENFSSYKITRLVELQNRL